MYIKYKNTSSWLFIFLDKSQLEHNACKFYPFLIYFQNADVATWQVVTFLERPQLAVTLLRLIHPAQALTLCIIHRFPWKKTFRLSHIYFLMSVRYKIFALQKWIKVKLLISRAVRLHNIIPDFFRLVSAHNVSPIWIFLPTHFFTALLSLLLPRCMLLPCFESAIT